MGALGVFRYLHCFKVGRARSESVYFFVEVRRARSESVYFFVEVGRARSESVYFFVEVDYFVGVFLYFDPGFLNVPADRL